MSCHFLSLILFFRTLYSKTQRQLFLVILNYSQSLPLLSRTWSLLSPFHPACSFFALLVPFLPPKGTTLHSTLCIFLFFSLQACIFFIYLVSFLPKTSFKKDTTLCFHYSHPCRAQLYYIFLLVFSSIFFSYLTRAIVNTQKNGNSIDQQNCRCVC